MTDIFGAERTFGPRRTTCQVCDETRAYWVADDRRSPPPCLACLSAQTVWACEEVVA